MSEDASDLTYYIITISESDLHWMQEHFEKIMRGPDSRPGNSTALGLTVVGIARALNGAREVRWDTAVDGPRTYVQTD